MMVKYEEKLYNNNNNNNMKYNTDIIIDNNKCMCRKNKTDGLFTQCPHKKKDGHFCGKHIKNKWKVRVDETLTPILLKNYQNFINKSNSKDVSIITINDYLTKGLQNYNCDTLKKTLRHYKLSIQGKKDALFTRLQNHLDSLKTYALEEHKIISLQTKIRYFLKKRNIVLRGPALYQRKICNNAEDFYTFETVEEIPFDKFFSYKDSDNFIYGFDIKSFHKLIELKQSNPYNRKAIPNKAITNLQKLLEINKNKNLLDEDKCEILTNKQKFNQNVLRIFQHIESLTSSVNIEWFLSLTIPELKKYYKSLEDIWNYRAELNLTQKINIVKDKTMFPVTVHNFYKYNNLNKLRNIILHEIDKLIFTADEDSDKTLACYYVLTAFCEVSNEARTVFPWLVQM